MTEERTTIRRHPLIFPAFLVSLFVLVIPVQADTVYAALHAHRFWYALSVAAGTILLALGPLLWGELMTKRHPQRWKRTLLNTVVWVIIGLNVSLNAVVFGNYVMKVKCEHAAGP